MYLDRLVHQFYRQLSMPSKHRESGVRVELNMIGNNLNMSNIGLNVKESFDVREKD